MLQVEPKASYITALLSSVLMVGPVIRGRLSRCVAKSQLDAVSCGRSQDRTYIVPVESLHASSLAPVQQSLNSQTPETKDQAVLGGALAALYRTSPDVLLQQHRARSILGIRSFLLLMPFS